MSESVKFLTGWAADIRASSGTSVDADSLEEAASIITSQADEITRLRSTLSEAEKRALDLEASIDKIIVAIRGLIPSEPHDAEGRAKEALQKLAALTEDRAQELLDRWSKDLGATPETKAAGVASHIINDLHADISVMLTRLDRAALERSEG